MASSRAASPRILLVHLKDDFNGSSKVAAEVGAVLRAAGCQLTCVVGSDGEAGFIRRAHPVVTVPYRFAASRWVTLWHFARAQLALYRHVSRACRRGEVDLLWMNAVLPAAAALAAWRRGVPVVSHVHEVGLGTPALFRLVKGIAWRTSTRLACVSHYVAEALQAPPARTTILYNALPPSEEARAAAIADVRGSPGPGRPFRVLMACSLRWYKGVGSFMAMARRLDADPGLAFRLVLSCEPDEFEAFAREHAGTRVELIHRPPSVFDHYAQADLVVNLSDPAGWIETFGLTLLEAMACGIPVVAPVVGGCTELFEEGRGGWRIAASDPDRLDALVRRLAVDTEAWREASRAARAAAARFGSAAFAQGVRDIVRELA